MNQHNVKSMFLIMCKRSADNSKPVLAFGGQSDRYTLSLHVSFVLIHNFLFGYGIGRAWRRLTPSSLDPVAFWMNPIRFTTIFKNVLTVNKLYPISELCRRPPCIQVKESAKRFVSSPQSVNEAWNFFSGSLRRFSHAEREVIHWVWCVTHS